MPFKKIPGTDKYVTPSGKKMSRKAMQAYKNRKGSNNPNSKRNRSRKMAG